MRHVGGLGLYNVPNNKTTWVRPVVDALTVRGKFRVSVAFFEKPILNSPYAYPARHWELDASGRPTQRIVEARRSAEFITSIPKPKKQKGAGKQDDLLVDERLPNQDTRK